MITKVKNPQKRMTEQQLKNKFNIAILGIVTMLLIGIISIFFFAPQVGSFFGLFSKNRNDEGYKPTAKPTPPVFENLPEAVNKNELNLNGKAQPGDTIILYVNGPEKDKTTADSEGNFSFVSINLINGKNTLFAKVINENNLESDKTDYFYVTVDKEKPEIEIEEPSDGDTVKNLNKRVNIIGKINEKAAITINGGIVVQKSDFSFDYNLGVKEGNIKIEIKAIDPAGNETVEELNIKYEEESS